MLGNMSDGFASSPTKGARKSKEELREIYAQ